MFLQVKVSLWEFDTLTTMRMVILMRFYERFYQALDAKSSERGWQNTFAEQAGITQAALSKIISRKTKSPGIESISAIIDALGIEALYPDTGCYDIRTFRAENEILKSEIERLKQEVHDLKVINNELRGIIQRKMDEPSTMSSYGKNKKAG